MRARTTSEGCCCDGTSPAECSAVCTCASRSHVRKSSVGVHGGGVSNEWARGNVWRGGARTEKTHVEKGRRLSLCISVATAEIMCQCAIRSKHLYREKNVKKSGFCGPHIRFTHREEACDLCCGEKCRVRPFLCEKERGGGVCRGEFAPVFGGSIPYVECALWKMAGESVGSGDIVKELSDENPSCSLHAQKI